MSARVVISALAAWSLLACAGCRDEGLVGEGSACAEGCPTNQRCTNGACVPVNDGVAGDDSDDSDEGDRDHDGHDDRGEPGDGPPNEPFPDP